MSHVDLRSPTAALLSVFLCLSLLAAPQHDSLEERVHKVLEKRRGTWRDMNVPEIDGRTLHDLIVKHKYTRALEIGTSTGHSGLWIGLALSKTGGKLITIDIDKRRHTEAVRNFEEAGLSPYIEAVLGDAHELVPKLSGPFDFVFCDADKDWYVNYLKAVLPKLAPGGCFAAHNVSGPGWGWTRDYWNLAANHPQLTPIVDKKSPAGLTLSFRK
jgi:predicted O-methyltransferase YrrM